ncbi:hypothetical protein Agub_g10191 [Astrephomene gubernaculifera]|uniref:C2 domain-containing protein n=1 Tax=Astrephomene gubernaculifera TaxID=47775 RepID=A0AAD3DUG9_9CHLO|nr:hypothetical protein Agub_g10191 [Astrephomene gubernaculifera]
MALEAGEVSVTIEFAQGLKDKDWFGRQDPYCVLSVGGQHFRTHTATDGGRNPVWNQTFRFNVINENDVELTIKDSDVGRDDNIGTARISLARARQFGRDTMQAPVYSKHGKQHGFVQVSLVFTPNKATGAYSGYPAQQYAQYSYPQQVPGYGVPPPAYGAYGAPPPAYGAPPPAYGAPAGYPPPGAAYPPPGGAGYPSAPQQPGYPPQQSYPPPGQYGAPAPYGAPPQAPYGAPPPTYGYPPR